MSADDSLDALFREALSVLDAGEAEALARLLEQHPRLAGERLVRPGEWLRQQVGGAVDGFFRDPYLLWFVAEDPVRHGQLPSNIAAVASVIITAIRRHAPATLQEQLDYALQLVAWSWIARQCDVQIALIDTLADAGAALAGSPENALVNGNHQAAAHLVGRGAPLSLATALCLERWDDVARLGPQADYNARQFGFVLAALNGKAEALRRMIAVGVEVDQPSHNLYSHGTPLHHAVCSGSLDAVQVLVAAGANVHAEDSLWQGTPLGWAEHYMEEHKGKETERVYTEIAAFLREPGTGTLR